MIHLHLQISSRKLLLKTDIFKDRPNGRSYFLSSFLWVLSCLDFEKSDFYYIYIIMSKYGLFEDQLCMK